MAALRNSPGLELGEGKRKLSSQKKGDIRSQKKGKTAYHSPVLPRIKASEAFKCGGQRLPEGYTTLKCLGGFGSQITYDISIWFNIN